MNILKRILIVEFAIFAILCAITFIKGIVVGIYEGAGFGDCLVWSIGPIMVPCFILVVFFFFIALLPAIARVLFTIIAMVYIVVITACISIPMAGNVPPKTFDDLSEVERIDHLKMEAMDIWKKAQADPNGTEAEWVRNWEMWNHEQDSSGKWTNINRKYESQFSEYDKKKADLIKDKQIKENSKSARLKFLDWFFPG